MIRCGGISLLLLFLSTQAYAKADLTVVQIAGWTTKGDRIEKIWAELTPIDGTEEYKGSGMLVNVSVPVGEYILRVSAPGFQMRRQVLKAYQPTVFRSVALPIVLLHGQTGPSFTGTVRNYNGDIRDLRVRLMSLYGNELRESVIDAHGSFSFPVDEGEYILLIVADLPRAFTIVESRPMRVYGERSVTIDLKGKHGTLVPLAPG